MLGAFRYSAARAASKAAYISAGSIVLLVGIAFLTAGAWIHLSTVQSPVAAAVIIGSVYTGAGLIFISIGLRPRVAVVAAPVPATAPATGLMMQAFMFGLQAGASTDRKRS